MQATAQNKKQMANRFKRWGAYLLVGAALCVAGGIYMTTKDSLMKEPPVKNEIRGRVPVITEAERNQNPALKSTQGAFAKWMLCNDFKTAYPLIEKTLPLVAKLATSKDEASLNALYNLVNYDVLGTKMQEQALEFLVSKGEQATKDEIIGAFAILLLSSEARFAFKLRWSEMLGVGGNKPQDIADDYISPLHAYLAQFKESNPRYAILADVAKGMLGGNADKTLTGNQLVNGINRGKKDTDALLNRIRAAEMLQLRQFVEIANSL